MLYWAVKAGLPVKQVFKDLIDGFRYYHCQIEGNNPVKYHSERGTAVNGGHGLCFFDDNIWTARNYLFAYEVFGDDAYLHEAQRIERFVHTGWNTELGGVVWRA